MGKKDIDWEGVEREYRAGQLSVAEIGRQFGCSHVAVLKRAKKYGWTRDLSEKVRQEVTARLVTDEVTAPGRETLLKAKEAIELAATRGVQVVREHRALIASSIDAVRKLIEELHRTMAKIDEVEADIIEDTACDKNSKRRAQMLASIALPQRSNCMATLAQALKTLTALERQAFNLDDKGGAEPEMPVNGTLTLDAKSLEMARRFLEG